MKFAGRSFKCFLVWEAYQPRRTRLRFTREPDFVSDEEHNVCNELKVVLAHHESSLWLQKCLHDGEMRKVALSS